MKITLLLLLATLMQVSAATFAQEVTINVKRASIKEVFEKVQDQTGYDFLYSSSDLSNSKPVSLTLDKVSLKQFLELCFKDQPLSYMVQNTTILITKKEAPAKSPVNQAGTIAAKADITGKVTDESGLPLPGVNVTLKGSKVITASDNNGIYKITAPDGKGTLVFTSIGYVTQEVNIGTNLIINVILKEKLSGLNEVVVVGYGTQKRKDLTGSVTSVNVEDLQKAPVRSFEEALSGRVAGVQATANDGQPGAAYTISIRGNNSLTQDNSPLYVVDGFPIENPNNNAINPADIESIDVLKDASATAIYGARGANGVIVITTKRGKNAPATVNVDSYYGYNQVAKKQAMMGPYEFVKLQSQFYSAYTDTTYLKNATLESYRNVPGLDWQDLIEQKGPFQNNNVAVRGGSPTGNYSISLSSTDQKGIIINSGFKRYGGRVVLDQQVGSKIKTGININYSYSKAYGTVVASYGGSSPALSLMGSVYAYRPIAGSINDPNAAENDANLEDAGQDLSVNTSTDFRYNPLRNVQNILNDRFTNTTVINGYFQYQPFKDITLKISAGVNRAVNENNLFYNSKTNLGDRSTAQGFNGPNGNIALSQVNSYLNENTLTYNKTFSRNHHLNVLGGFTLQGQQSNASGYSATSLPNENLGLSGLDEGVASTLTSARSENTLASFLGRINYNYRSTYYFTATYRADGSSKFAPENHWSYFPSGAVSWRITNEKFMKNLLSVVSDAKLRASYGVTGNNRVTDFAYLSTITLPVRNGYTFNSVFNQGAILATLGNQKLKWETTGQLDIGLDLELLKGRISVAADYYKKITSNLLLNAALPGSVGYTSSFENIGKVQNSGFEFTLNTVNVRAKDFSWSSNFNISFNRNKVLELVEGQDAMLTYVAWSTNSYSTAPSYIAKIGQPISKFYGYVFDGIYQYSDFNQTATGAYVLKDNIPNNGALRSTIQPGQIKFRDINNDGIVDTKDQTIIGDPNPTHIGGFSNNFAYKGFDLNVLLQWSYGNQVENANRYVYEGSTSLNRNQLASYADRWSPDNQNSIIPINNGPNVYSSRVLEDGSFLRLKTAQLGYAIPAKILKRANIKSVRFYVSGQNLVTWTKYSGPDPEVSAFNTALTTGFDFSAYPRARTVTMGINVIL